MIEKYYKYRYYFPPRPELKVPHSSIGIYDNGAYLGQPKLNGSCCELFISDEVIQKGRHDNTLTVFNLSNEEMMDVFGNNGKWNLIVGEYMNKSKKDENGDLFNHKFVIFDQLVHNNNYLLGVTFEERVKLITDLYKPIDETEFLYKISDNIWMVKTFYKDFKNIWNKIVEVDMLEGFVMKRKSAKLERGTREKNNHMSQFKCRKETKNYSY